MVRVVLVMAKSERVTTVRMRVRGATYYELDTLLASHNLKIKDEVVLISEPNNRYDKFAVAIIHKMTDKMLGHVPRDLSETYTKYISQNRILFASIQEIKHSENVKKLFINVTRLTTQCEFPTAIETITNGSGAYIIENKSFGRFYVGSSQNIRKRLYTHFRALYAGIHHNDNLQADFNAKPNCIYKFKVFQSNNSKDAREGLEKKIIRELIHKNAFLYNKTDDGLGVIGVDHTSNNFDYTEGERSTLKLYRHSENSVVNKYINPKDENIDPLAAFLQNSESSDIEVFRERGVTPYSSHHTSNNFDDTEEERSELKLYRHGENSVVNEYINPKNETLDPWVAFLQNSESTDMEIFNERGVAPDLYEKWEHNYPSQSLPDTNRGLFKSGDRKHRSIVEKIREDDPKFNKLSKDVCVFDTTQKPVKSYDEVSRRIEEKTRKTDQRSDKKNEDVAEKVRNQTRNQQKHLDSTHTKPASQISRTTSINTSSTNQLYDIEKIEEKIGVLILANIESLKYFVLASKNLRDALEKKIRLLDQKKYWVEELQLDYLRYKAGSFLIEKVEYIESLELANQFAKDVKTALEREGCSLYKQTSGDTETQELFELTVRQASTIKKTTLTKRYTKSSSEHSANINGSYLEYPNFRK